MHLLPSLSDPWDPYAERREQIYVGLRVLDFLVHRHTYIFPKKKKKMLMCMHPGTNSFTPRARVLGTL